MDDWVLAPDKVIDEFVPHSEDTYRDYLQWYLPRTRGHVTFTPATPQPRLATIRDEYPTHRDRDYFMGVRRIFITYYNYFIYLA